MLQQVVTSDTPRRPVIWRRGLWNGAICPAAQRRTSTDPRIVIYNDTRASNLQQQWRLNFWSRKWWCFSVCSVGIYLLAVLTYLITPWSRVLLEKLASLQLVKKFPAFYGTRRFLTALTSTRHIQGVLKLKKNNSGAKRLNVEHFTGTPTYTH